MPNNVTLDDKIYDQEFCRHCGKLKYACECPEDDMLNEHIKDQANIDSLFENWFNRDSKLTFAEVQSRARAWQSKNFDIHDKTATHNLLGVGEEVGELMHAHLKGEQGIRHTPEQIKAMKENAVGDIIIFLSNYCYAENIDIAKSVEDVLNEIEQRDWRKNPLNAGKEDV